MAKNKENKVTEGQVEENVQDTAIDLEQLLEEEKKRTQEMKDIAQRVQAEFENYRKRNQEAVREARLDGENYMLTDMMVVLDSFERAMTQIENPKEKEGLEKIYKQFQGFFEKKGVEEIKALGEKFDPMYHNAIMMVEDKDNEDVVVEVLQKGYKRGDKVLRIPAVKVAK